MKTIKNPSELQQLAKKLKSEGKTIALVPTMGYFHEGHLSLMDLARKKADIVIVSLFVNPTQFGENEDLDSYPHDLERDSKLAEEHGVDYLFAPKKDDMYDEEHETWVEVPNLAKNLCGSSRPIHFRGVATVVTKLFMLALPDVAIFGQKDWQQLAIIKKMVSNLNYPVDIIGSPIVREKSGLALSSRNVYLTEDQKKVAPLINLGLRKLKDLVDKGETDTKILKEFLNDYYRKNITDCDVDYIEIVHPENINILNNIESSALCAVAIKLGSTRLIDNMLVKM